MKKTIVYSFAVLVVAGSVLAVRSVQGTNIREINVYDEELETEVKVDMPEQSDTVQINAEERIKPKIQYKEQQTEIEKQDEDTIQVEIENDTKEEQNTSGSIAAEIQAKEEAAAEAEAEAKAKAKALAEVQAKEENALAESQTQMQITSQTENVVIEVSRTYIEDCGSDSGYWEITYSDGHIEYIDD